MATKTVAAPWAWSFHEIATKAAKEAAQRVGHEWGETDTFERIATRLNGIKALVVAMQIAEEGGATEKLMTPLLELVGAVADDVHRDAEQLAHEGRALFEAGKAA